MTQPDFTDPLFREKIIWSGDGPNPYDKDRPFRYKRKMMRGGYFREWPNHQGITVGYEWISQGNKTPEGRWGMLCIVAFIAGSWYSWNIEHLRVETERDETSSVNTDERPWCRDWVDVAFIKRNSPFPGYRIKKGDWIGFFIVAHPDGVDPNTGEPHQSNVVSDILPVQFDGLELPRMRGNNWPQGRAPQLAMAPILPLFTSRSDVDLFVDTFVYEHGFNGLNVPMQWEEPNDALLYLLNRADNEGFWVHLWMYGDRQSSTAPDDLNTDRDHQRVVAGLLRPYKNWSMGLGYDIQEWATVTQIAAWVSFMEREAPDHLYGARRRNENESNGVPEGTAPYPGSYAGWEWWIIPKSIFKNQLARCLFSSHDLPAMWEERGRLRNSGGQKDFKNQTELYNAIRDAVNYNVAGIWGIGDFASDVGSQDWDQEWRPSLQQLMHGPLGEPIEPDPEEEEDEEEMSVSKDRLVGKEGWAVKSSVQHGLIKFKFDSGDVTLTQLDFWIPFKEMTTCQILTQVEGVTVDQFWAVQKLMGNSDEQWTRQLRPYVDLQDGDEVTVIVNSGELPSEVFVRVSGFKR